MFSERFKALRLEKKLTQNELAMALGVSNKTISVYEKGTSSPTLETLEKIAAYFNVTIDYLIGYSDKPNPEVETISAELNLSEEAVTAIMLLTNNKNKSNLISNLLENSNFINFLTNIALYLSMSNEDIDKMTHQVFDDFPVSLPRMSQEEKCGIISNTIRTQALDFLTKALDDLKPPTE